MTEDNKGEPLRIPRISARAAVLPFGRGVPFDWSLPDGRGWLARNLAYEVEQRRLFPWIAVCFGLGH